MSYMSRIYEIIFVIKGRNKNSLIPPSFYENFYNNMMYKITKRGGNILYIIIIRYFMLFVLCFNVSSESILHRSPVFLSLIMCILYLLNNIICDADDDIVRLQ